MLQRVQTIYLTIALFSASVMPYLLPLWKLDSDMNFYFIESIGYVSLFGLSTSLSIISIMSFKNRQLQFVLGRLNIILNLILLGLFVYRSLNVSGEIPRVSEKGIGMFLPVLSIVMLVLANKAIKKDEDLVKSIDRLR